MGANIPRIYPWLGMLAGYGVVLFFNPIHLALRDGLRCILRFKRIWVTFVVLGFAYSVFQFATFTPLHGMADLDFSQVTSPGSWDWPAFVEVWREVPLPTLEGVAGLFDNATTTYPLSIVAAVLLLINWRGLHVGLVRALGKRYGFWGYVIYLVVVISAVAALLKPIAFWRLPEWGAAGPTAKLLRISA